MGWLEHALAVKSEAGGDGRQQGVIKAALGDRDGVVYAAVSGGQTQIGIVWVSGTAGARHTACARRPPGDQGIEDRVHNGGVRRRPGGVERVALLGVDDCAEDVQIAGWRGVVVVFAVIRARSG